MTNDISVYAANEPQIQHAGAGQNAALVYLAGLQSDASRRAMRHQLTRIAEIIGSEKIESAPWGSLRFAHVRVIASALSALPIGPASVNQSLAALRQVIKTARKLHQIDADAAADACDIRDIRDERPEAAETGHALTMGEMMALVGATQDGTAAGARDAAMLAVAYSCGLRRGEIVNLDLEDYHDGELLIRKGKGNRTRMVPIANGAKNAVDDWLQLRGNAPGPLFWGVRKNGVMVPRRLTTQAVYHVFAKLAEAAGVAEFSPHDLRRTFAGDMLDNGADIVTVQKLMGHASSTTTAGYDRRGKRAKIAAAKLLHFPYQRARR